MMRTTALRALPRGVVARQLSTSAASQFAQPSESTATPAAGTKPPQIKEFKIYRWVCIRVTTATQHRAPRHLRTEHKATCSSSRRVEPK